MNAPDTKLDTLNNVTVNIDVESPHDDNDLIILFVIVDKVPLLSNTRQSSCMNLALCLTWQLEGSTEIYGKEASTATGWQKGDQEINRMSENLWQPAAGQAP